MSAAERLTDPVDAVGESPVWRAAESALYWVDIPARRIHRLKTGSGRRDTWTAPEAVACIAFRGDGTLIAGLESGIFALVLEAGGRVAATRLAAPRFPMGSMRFNDGRCDRQGRFWVGSMEDPVNRAGPKGALYRFGADHACLRAVDGLFVANGLAFSPDGRTLYHSDSFREVRTIWAWALDRDDGVISNRRVFVDTHGMPGRPDGGAVDTDGCYWMAGNDGWEIVRFTPKGAVDRRIALPVAKPSMVAFGGPELDVIYVTSIRPPSGLEDQPMAGSLFAVEARVTGLPEPRFKW